MSELIAEPISSGRPSGTSPLLFPPSSGAAETSAAEATPGTDATRSSMRWNTRVTSSGVWYEVSGSDTRPATTPRGSKPGSTLLSATEPRIKRPAPVSSTTARAISATTLLERLVRRPGRGAEGGHQAEHQPTERGEPYCERHHRTIHPRLGQAWH